MNEHDKNELPSDEMLVAFIDGELDAAKTAEIEKLINADEATAERFEFLSRSDLPYVEAFAPLLKAAPDAKLQAMLGAIPATTPRKFSTSGVSRRGFLAAAAACLIAGIAVDRGLIELNHRLEKPDEGAEWRAVVAQYLGLYTADTLSAPAGDRAAQAAQLEQVGSKLGISLTPETVALSGADFRRAQVLEYDGKPLAQIAYLDPEDGPMALCIISSQTGPAEPDMERRHGMNVVYWSSAGHAFMLIGHSTADRMKTMADGVRAKLAA
ncbi:anti-sigma factor family protein [Rhizobium tubonense]|uniref:anti-sigma factor family protein n=1 Tax=Rhizobium tubonense TaxID=484088 RepID=UPI0018A7E9BC|nr:anti-sigma factor [Rhizobium tubonense]